MAFIDPDEKPAKAGFKDPDQPAPPKAPARSTAEIMLGINRPPMNEEQRAAYEDVMDKRPWGSGAPKAFYDLGGWVTDETKSPLAGAAANFLANAIPTFFMMTKGLPGPTATEESAQALAGQRQAVLSKGRELGLKVPPSQANPSAANRVIESIGGKAATAQEASAVNQNVAYSVAQREAGLAPSEAITKESLKAARTRLAEPYREVGQLESTGPFSRPPFKSPAQTLEELRSARKEANQLWNYYNRQGIPETQKAAEAATSRASALEQALERQATDAGRPDLVEQLRAARTAIAKNFTVKNSLRGSTFDPAALARLETYKDVPLTGDLETLMQMYKDFPGAMKAPQVGGSVGVNQLLPWIGGSAGGTAGAMLGGTQGAGMGAAAGMVLGQALPPAARSLMLSPLYQSLFANVPQGLGNPSLLRLLANPALADPAAESAGALYQSWGR